MAHIQDIEPASNLPFSADEFSEIFDRVGGGDEWKSMASVCLYWWKLYQEIQSRVCTSWLQLYLPKARHTSIDMTLVTTIDTEQLAYYLQQHGSSVKHLSLQAHSQLCSQHSYLHPVVNIPTAIQTSCSSLMSLHLKDWPAYGDFPVLSSCSQLSTMQLQNCMAIPPSFFAALPRGLKSLSIISSGIPWNDLQPGCISRSVPFLYRLDLADSGFVPSEHVAALKGLKHLQDLCIKVNTFEALQQVPGLPCRKVQVSLPPFQDPLAPTLLQFENWCTRHGPELSLATLELTCSSPSFGQAALDPHPNHLIATALRRIKTLQNLVLEGSALTVRNPGDLSGLSQLTSLSIRLEQPTFSSAVLGELGRLSGLQELKVKGVRGERLREEAAGVLQASLPSLRKLTVRC